MPLDLDIRQQLIDTIARFTRDRLIPIEDHVARNDAIPENILAEMRALGLFGLSIPQEYGGLGLNLEEEILVLFELCQASPAFRSAIGTNIGIGSQGLVKFGTAEQKQYWLPKLASGEAVASFALTEPDAGSDAAGLRTTAMPDGDHFVLNGTKRYITNAGRADLFTVMARTDPADNGAHGISAFAVPATTPGITVGKPERKMGQQGAHVHDVVFEDCCIPKSSMIGAQGEGFILAMQVLDRGRIHIAAVCVGVAGRLTREMTEYAAGRKQFGKAIGEFQLIQAMLADSQTDTYAARTMVRDAAQKYDTGANVSTEAACAKLFASEAVGRIADRAVQVFGGAGYIADYGIERFYRDVRLFRIYEGTSQIQQLVIAKNMLRNIKDS